MPVMSLLVGERYLLREVQFSDGPGQKLAVNFFIHASRLSRVTSSSSDFLCQLFQNNAFPFLPPPSPPLWLPMPPQKCMRLTIACKILPCHLLLDVCAFSPRAALAPAHVRARCPRRFHIRFHHYSLGNFCSLLCMCPFIHRLRQSLRLLRFIRLLPRRPRQNRLRRH